MGGLAKSSFINFRYLIFYIDSVGIIITNVDRVKRVTKYIWFYYKCLK